MKQNKKRKNKGHKSTPSSCRNRNVIGDCYLEPRYLGRINFTVQSSNEKPYDIWKMTGTPENNQTDSDKEE